MEFATLDSGHFLRDEPDLTVPFIDPLAWGAETWASLNPIAPQTERAAPLKQLSRPAMANPISSAKPKVKVVVARAEGGRGGCRLTDRKSHSLAKNTKSPSMYHYTFRTNSGFSIRNHQDAETR